MAQGLASPNPSERETPPFPSPLAVDPTAPHVREFILRELLRGTIRVFPGGRGKLFLLSTGTPPVIIAGPTANERMRSCEAPG